MQSSGPDIYQSSIFEEQQFSDFEEPKKPESKNNNNLTVSKPTHSIAHQKAKI
jgi:hypothetical protein